MEVVGCNVILPAESNAIYTATSDRGDLLEEETNDVCTKSWVKGKAVPLQAWTGPEGSSRLRLPDFKTIGT